MKFDKDRVSLNNIITMDIYFGGNKKVFADVNGFTVKTDQAMIQTAGLCAVKRHLREDIAVNVKVVRD